MGRRKIEIKAIKDDRNRSVTFLKRKGGLFKKAHELSVLCSVDVAVFVFGNNKKLYEYSSADMSELMTKYQFHSGPSERKGPSDFNGGGNDDDEDEEADGTPPHGLPADGLENHMMPPQYHAHPHVQHQQPPLPQQQQHLPYPHVRNTPSASPPVHNGAVFPGHPHHQRQRSHTPQAAAISRPHSRNDSHHRMGPSVPPQASNMAYMQTPPMYNAQTSQPPAPPPQVHPAGIMAGPQYPFQSPAMQHQQHPHHAPVYMEERKPSVPPTYAAPAPPQPIPAPVNRVKTSPPQPNHQHVPQISTTSPQPEQGMMHEPQPPPPPPPLKKEPSNEPRTLPQPPLLNTDTVKRLPPQRKSHSIFTPIEENRSILSQHLESFTSDSQTRSDQAAMVAAANSNRAQTLDVGAGTRTASPGPSTGSNNSADVAARPISVPSIPEAKFAPPPRANSLTKTGPGSVAGGSRPRGPRLTVQIPDGASEAGGSGVESTTSPYHANNSNSNSNNSNQAGESLTPLGPQRHNSHSSIVLPPPSPSASALLSAGATGPPNPFAKPPPQQSVTAETPASALPSRFLGSELLPSPGSFYNDWNFRTPNDGNTLPSPLNFATPINPTGPGFGSRDEGIAKRKSPEPESAGPENAEAKRTRVD